MNPHKAPLRALLDDLLPPSDESHGPDCAEVLALLRSERVRRQRRHTVAASVAIAAVATLLMLPSLLQKSPPTTVPFPVAVAIRQPAPAPAALVIEHVNDEELINLLHDTPSALMKWPNGDRTLLVLKR